MEALQLSKILTMAGAIFTIYNAIMNFMPLLDLIILLLFVLLIIAFVREAHQESYAKQAVRKICAIQ